MFTLVAAVEEWPRILPHYRWVRRVAVDGPRRTLDMAARRDFFPVRWRAVVEPLPAQRLVRFTHVGGPARGMAVEWRLTPAPGGTRVAIHHRFRSPIPVVGRLFAEYVVGRLFVQNIAAKTLRAMKRAAERGEVAPRRGHPEGRG